MVLALEEKDLIQSWTESKYQIQHLNDRNTLQTNKLVEQETRKYWCLETNKKPALVKMLSFFNKIDKQSAQR